MSPFTHLTQAMSNFLDAVRRCPDDVITNDETDAASEALGHSKITIPSDSINVDDLYADAIVQIGTPNREDFTEVHPSDVVLQFDDRVSIAQVEEILIKLREMGAPVRAMGPAAPPVPLPAPVRAEPVPA